MHIIGDERPTTGLRNKVKRINFKQVVEIMDPITFEVEKKPIKPFMVTQLQIAFEREKIMLSPFDEVLHKQLIDYVVEKISASGQPVFTSKDEHFVDAIGLAYLAMVQNFKDLTDMIKDPVTTTKVEFSKGTLGGAGLNSAFAEVESKSGQYKNHMQSNVDLTERKGDRPDYNLVKVPLNYRSNNPVGNNWGARSTGARSSNRGYGRAGW